MIIELLATFVGILAAWVLTRINKNLKLTYISKAVDELILAAEQTVLELQQTMVDDMKAAGGKLSSSDIRNLKTTLVAKVKEKTSEEALDILKNAQVDVNALISGAGEAMIQRSKNV